VGVVMTSVPASVVLLTYNQEAFVKESLQSLLDQDYADLEIVVSDDGSTDATWQVIQQTLAEYKGFKKVVVNRNPLNLGIVGNYFKALSFSAGEVIFTAAGDDVSLPNRCSACIFDWLNTGKEVDLIASDGYDMLLSGEMAGAKETDELSLWSFEKWAQKRPFVFGASHMMTRRLLALRVLDSKLPVEDQNLVARAFLMGGAKRLPIPLVKHRRGGISQTKIRFSYQAKKLKLIQSAYESILERDELLRDAEILGKEIKPCLSSQLSLANYMISIFNASSGLSRLKVFITYSNVPFMKRLRFFQLAAFPNLYTTFLKLKKSSRM